MSDGTEALRWYADEVLVCEGDLVGKTKAELRSLHSGATATGFSLKEPTESKRVAILVVIEVPGGNAALDEALREAWHTTSDPPAGNRLRMAGPMEGGWRVIGLWDSQEQFREFMEQRLHLALDDAGEGEPTITFWEIQAVDSFE